LKIKDVWCGHSLNAKQSICRVILIKGLGYLSRYSHFLLKWTEIRQAIAFQERARPVGKSAGKME
jgi:hypothetical protein